MDVLFVYHIGTGLITLAVIAAATFGLLYGLSAPWWRSLIGWMFIVEAAALVIGFGTVVVQVYTNAPPPDLTVQRVILRIIGYGAAFVACCFPVFVFLRVRTNPGSGVPVAPEFFWVIRRLFRRKDTSTMTIDPVQQPQVPITTETVPQVWYKAQRVLRTIVQTGIPAFLTFALVLPLIIQALGLPVTSSLYVWLIGFAAGVTAVAAAITRIMAIPAVNTFLVKIGLGTVPASALTGTPASSAFPQVKPDPKVAL